MHIPEDEEALKARAESAMLPRPITPAGFLPAAAAISKGFVDPDLTHSDAVVERMVENRTLEVGQQRAIIKYVSQELTAFDCMKTNLKPTPNLCTPLTRLAI